MSVLSYFRCHLAIDTMNANQREKLLTTAIITSVVAVFFALLIVVIHTEGKRHIKVESTTLLDAVASSKEVLLSDWFQDEMHDVSTIAKDSRLVNLIARYVDGQDDESAVVTTFNQIKSEHQYAELVFLNVAGEYQTSTNPALTFNDSIDRGIFLKALQTDSCFASDIYRSAIDQHIYIDLVAVVRRADGSPLGGVIFKIDPSSSIDKMLVDWRRINHKGSIFLIRQQLSGGWLMYNPEDTIMVGTPCWIPLPERLRDNPLNPRLKLIRVFDLPHTPWKVMAVFDDSKRKSDLQSSLFLSVTIGLILVVLFFFGLLAYLSISENKKSRKLFEKEEELEVLELQFRFSMDVLSEAVVITDAQGVIRYMNLSAEQLCGWRIDESEGKSLEKYFPLFQKESGMPLLSVRNWFSGERGYNQHIDAYLLEKSGLKINVSCSIAPLDGKKNSPRGVVIVLTKDNKEQTGL